MKNILIIDDDKEIRSVLSSILMSEGYEVITAGTGKEALKKIGTHSPDLVLLDIKLPGMNGMKVLEEIKQRDKKLIVIMLTGYGDIKDAVQAIKMGAFNYITKPFENEEILVNINEALQSSDVSNGTLTLREKEVVRWIKKGKSSWEIAAILGISERTVNFHVNNIKQKLNVVSRTQAVAIAIEQGLITEE